eukprot:COSAG05_NODE_715_length_7805_cov_5.098235_1_plen_243_part_00
MTTIVCSNGRQVVVVIDFFTFKKHYTQAGCWLAGYGGAGAGPGRAARSEAGAGMATMVATRSPAQRLRALHRQLSAGTPPASSPWPDGRLVLAQGAGRGCWAVGRGTTVQGAHPFTHTATPQRCCGAARSLVMWGVGPGVLDGPGADLALGLQHVLRALGRPDGKQPLQDGVLWVRQSQVLVPANEVVHGLEEVLGGVGARAEWWGVQQTADVHPGHGSSRQVRSPSRHCRRSRPSAVTRCR